MIRINQNELDFSNFKVIFLFININLIKNINFIFFSFCIIGFFYLKIIKYYILVFYVIYILKLLKEYLEIKLFFKGL